MIQAYYPTRDEGEQWIGNAVNTPSWYHLVGLADKRTGRKSVQTNFFSNLKTLELHASKLLVVTEGLVGTLNKRCFTRITFQRTESARY
jgi:hypothetical protein